MRTNSRRFFLPLLPNRDGWKVQGNRDLLERLVKLVGLGLVVSAVQIMNLKCFRYPPVFNTAIEFVCCVDNPDPGIKVGVWIRLINNHLQSLGRKFVVCLLLFTGCDGVLFCSAIRIGQPYAHGNGRRWMGLDITVNGWCPTRNRPNLGPCFWRVLERNRKVLNPPVVVSPFGSGQQSGGFGGGSCRMQRRNRQDDSVFQCEFLWNPNFPDIVARVDEALYPNRIHKICQRVSDRVRGRGVGIYVCRCGDWHALGGRIYLETIFLFGR
mmetsp:Transcript_11085/g.28102  ORF Transcript_11085/g.28102 Transcript_11085/m.28102 type:complete len:268 (+) Transcript_11085:57-860(+)